MIKHLLITFFLTFSLASQAQLTSSNSNWNIQTDSLTQQSTLWLTITFDDISNLGGIEVSAYDVESGAFLMEFSFNRQGLIDNNYLTTSNISFPFITIEEGKQYRFDINPYNLQGAYIERTDLITTL